MSDWNIDSTTYSDDACIGAEAPCLELLNFHKGEKIDLQPGKVTVLYFFNTFYKGAFPINEELTVLAEKHAKDVNFIAINCDPEEEKLEKFFKKMADGLICDVVTKQQFRLDVDYVAYDANKATAKMYATAANQSIMSCPHLFVVGKDGKICWRQQLHQSHTLNQSNFEAQLVHILNGEELESAGPRPLPEDSGSDAEIEGDGGDIALF